jgi:hypothetical protein
MFEKITICVFLLVIFYCLGSALFYMLSPTKVPSSMGKALTWRIALSLALFLFLLAGAYMGWLHPHGLSSH